METKVLSFRMPQGWSALLDSIARKYNFASRGEMVRLVIIEAANNALKGKLKVRRGRIEAPTEVIACRLPESTLRAIGTLCCKQIKDTPSIWGALAVARWVKDLEKEDNRQQRSNMYPYYLRDFAENYRRKIVRLQYEIEHKQGVLRQ